MPVKIRLMRIGAKKRPFYRVVVVDERRKRTGSYIELLGTYNPLTEPKEIRLNQDRIDHWIKQGAIPSEGFLRISGKAPQKPPRPPKKKRDEQPSVETPAAETQPAETEVSGVTISQTEPATEEASATLAEIETGGDTPEESTPKDDAAQAQG